MGVFDAINETSSKAIDTSEAYVKASQNYYKLKVFQQLARAFSFFSKLAIIGGLLFLGLIMLIAALAIWLGDVMGSDALACLLIAGVLFLLTLIVFLIRHSIDKRIITKMSKEYFD